MSLVALLCIFSSISFLRYGLHACIQYFKWDLTIALYRGTIKLFYLYVIFLRIIPRTLSPLDAAILHCSETFMSAFIVWIHLHFQKLNICHFSDHLTNLSMSSCHFCLSSTGRGRRGMSARLRLNRNAPWLENCVRQDCDISHSEWVNILVYRMHVTRV